MQRLGGGDGCTGFTGAHSHDEQWFYFSTVVATCNLWRYTAHVHLSTVHVSWIRRQLLESCHWQINCVVLTDWLGKSRHQHRGTLGKSRQIIATIFDDYNDRKSNCSILWYWSMYHAFYGIQKDWLRRERVLDVIDLIFINVVLIVSARQGIGLYLIQRHSSTASQAPCFSTLFSNLSCKFGVASFRILTGTTLTSYCWLLSHPYCYR